MKSKLMRAVITSLIFVSMSMLNSCGNRRNDIMESNRSAVSKSVSAQDSTFLNDSLFVLEDTLIGQSGLPKKNLNKRNLVVKEWNTDVASNVRTLDHITTFNAEGKKIEEIEYNSEGQKWRERYEYNAKGVKIRELVYNGRNRLLYVKKYKYNEYGKKEMTYTYNSQGKLIAIKYYEYLTQ